MHYIIMEWCIDTKQWKVLFYTFEYEDYMKNSKRFPQSSSIVHMIDIKALKYHELMEKFRGPGIAKATN